MAKQTGIIKLKGTIGDISLKFRRSIPLENKEKKNKKSSIFIPLSR